MASLAESQAFLTNFDKCLPLCERGDAATVINALHTLNSITKASIKQAIELELHKDFACTFLIEMELALELHTAPVPRLGTIDGGLPELYSFTDEELEALSNTPSLLTKDRVRKFLDALGETPSARFDERSVADTVVAFLKCQVKPTSRVAPAKLTLDMRGHKISWADMCSSGSESETCSDSSSLPGLESDNESDSGCSTPSAPSSIQGEVEAAAEVIEEEEEGGEEEEETADFLDPESEPEECARVFLWAAPANAHDGEDGSRWGPGGEASARSREPFHKTRMCRTWRQTGHCSFGERCNFAHGVGEMRATEEGLQLLGGGGRGPSTRRQHESSDSSDTASTCSNETNLFGAVGGPLAAHHKTRMCKIFEKSGCCKFTGRCNYAHSREELVVRKSTGRCSADHKTRICKAFMRSGTCPYGDRCTFAHGREELRINVLQL